MTTERSNVRDASPAAARRRRPHPAGIARLVSTGAAAGLTFGIVAGLAVEDAAAIAASTPGPASQLDTIDGSGIGPAVGADIPGDGRAEVLPPRRVVVIRRIHLVPAPAVGAVNDAGALSDVALSDVAAFAPKAATRNSPQPLATVATKSVASAKRRPVRRAVKRAPVRQATRATRAS